MLKVSCRLSAAAADSQPEHIRLGKAGERAAAAFLKQRGFTIIETNWRQGRLELDLVCRHGAELVFVEVKTRRSQRYGGPAAGMTAAKIRNLSRAALAWLAARRAWNLPCRFDVLCLVSQGDAFNVEHFPHAFDLSQALDSGHTPW
ncbi:MAG: YraN family protein [Desulfovibrio sp.]|nr:YraN family protein [Desulfovibrio sp.]